MSTDRRAHRPGLGVFALLALLAGPAPAQAPDRVSDQAPDPASSANPGAETPGTEGAEVYGPRTYLSTSLALGIGRDEGFLVGDRQLDDSVGYVRPTLLLVHRPSERSELLVVYDPRFEYFDTYSDLAAADHAAGALWRHDLTRRSRFTAGGSLLDGEDPNRYLGDFTFLLPRSPYRQVRAYASLEHHWQLTSLALHVGRTTTRIEPPVGSDRGLFGAGVDEAEDSATLALDHQVGPRAALSASYSYVRPTLLGARAGLSNTLDEPIQTGVLGLRYSPSELWSLALSGGALETSGGGLSPLASAEIARSGKRTSLRLRYDRSLFSLAPAVAGVGATAVGGPLPTAAIRDSLSQVASLELDLRPADWLRWDQLLWASRATVPGSDALESWAARSRLLVHTARRVGTFAQVEWFEQRGATALGPQVSRVFFSVGFVVGLTGPAGSWGLSEKRDELARVLPYGGVD